MFGDLSGSEFAGVTQSLVAALQVIVVTQTCHDTVAEGLFVSRRQPLVIQDSSDLTGGVIVEQVVDLPKDFGFRSVSIAGVKRGREVEGSRGSALEAHVNDDLVTFHQRDIVDQQADHAFALLVRRVRVAPEGRKVRRQSEHPLPRLLIEQLTVVLRLLRVLFLGGRERPQLVVPFGFEDVRDEAMVRIDFHVPSAGRVGFILNALQVLLPQSIDVGETLFQFLYARPRPLRA